MKTKTPAFKLRPRKSIPPSFTSVASALLYQDEDNEENHLHGNDNGESMDTGSSEDNDNNNDDVDDKDDDEDEGYDDGCDKGIAGAYDNDLVPDDVNEEAEDDSAVPDDVNEEAEDDSAVPDDVNEKAEEDNVVSDGVNEEAEDDNVVSDDVNEEAEDDNVVSDDVNEEAEDYKVVPDDVNKEVADDNVVPDCVEVDASAGVKCVLADWLGVFSYSCSGGSSRVLVCSKHGCPISMHEVCMNTEPDFDDTGKFYCPYCWHSRVVARTLDLRREALLAKRELLNFIHLRRDFGNKEKQEDRADNMKEASLSTTAGEKNSGDCKNGLNDDANETTYYNQEQTMSVVSKGKEKPDGESTSKVQGPDNVADVQMLQEEDIENTSDGPLEDNKGKKRTSAKDATSKVPAIESFEYVSSDLDTGTFVRQKRIKHTAQRARPQQVDSPKSPSFQPGSSAKDKMTNLQGNTRTEKNSVQSQELNKQIRIPIMSSGKRRPLPWTIEEVDTLKEGVRRFSLTSNKNMPWRKILEFGHNVFDSNRIPVDLKDKWKQIMAKEDPKSNMGALIPFEEQGNVSRC